MAVSAVVLAAGAAAFAAFYFFLEPVLAALLLDVSVGCFKAGLCLVVLTLLFGLGKATTYTAAIAALTILNNGEPDYLPKKLLQWAIYLGAALVVSKLTTFAIKGNNINGAAGMTMTIFYLTTFLFLGKYVFG